MQLGSYIIVVWYRYSITIYELANRYFIVSIFYMSGTRSVRTEAPEQLPEQDFAVARIDSHRNWPSTVNSSRDVPYWKTVQDDKEAQEALREAGLG